MRQKWGSLTSTEDLQRTQTRCLHDRLEEQKLQKERASPPRCVTAL